MTMTKEQQDKLRRALYNAKFTTDAEDENPFVGIFFNDLLDIIHDFGQQHPNWIPVEEELPPIHYEGANSTDFVLIYDGDDVLIAYYDFKEKKWYNEQYGALIIPATHWMPMPKAPRKEE